MGPDEHTIGFIERVSGEPYAEATLTAMEEALRDAAALVSISGTGPDYEVLRVDKDAGTITLKKYTPPRSPEGHARWASARLIGWAGD